MPSDEDNARALIAELRRRALKKDGNREAFTPDELAVALGLSNVDTLAAILHAEPLGWVRPLRSMTNAPGGSSILRVRLEPPGFAEAGANPSPPPSSTTVVGDWVGGDKVGRDKIETHGPRSPVKKTDKEHIGDNKVSLWVRLKNGLGLG